MFACMLHNMSTWMLSHLDIVWLSPFWNNLCLGCLLMLNFHEACFIILILISFRAWWQLYSFSYCTLPKWREWSLKLLLCLAGILSIWNQLDCLENILLHQEKGTGSPWRVLCITGHSSILLLVARVCNLPTSIEILWKRDTSVSQLLRLTSDNLSSISELHHASKDGFTKHWCCQQWWCLL